MSNLEEAGSPENITQPIKVYWQPGCSSCLKTKEFLIDNGVSFESVNVLDDEKGFAELRSLGIKLVPIVARGTSWANGAVFRDVAKVAGFEYGAHKMLAPEIIKDKILTVDQVVIGVGFTPMYQDFPIMKMFRGLKNGLKIKVILIAISGI